MPPPPINDDDLDALADTSLEFFKAEPATIAPFASSHLSWKVNAPDKVKVLLEGGNVAKQGSRTVSPGGTHGYRLVAKAGAISKPLGTATVHVNLSQCVEIETAILHLFIEPVLKDKIDAETSGVYFRNIVTVDSQGHITAVRAKPKVWITPGRLNILLQLGQEVNNFPNPDVDISVSFGLAIVPMETMTILQQTKMVAINEQIDISINFPWYAWLVPGAQIGLPIAIDMAKEGARKKAHEMITQLVGVPSIHPSPGGGLPHDLNTFFAVPSQVPNGRKHGVRLYVNEFQDGIFAVTFCPANEPVIAGGGPVITGPVTPVIG